MAKPDVRTGHAKGTRSLPFNWSSDADPAGNATECLLWRFVRGDDGKLISKGLVISGPTTLSALPGQIPLPGPTGSNKSAEHTVVLLSWDGTVSPVTANDVSVKSLTYRIV
jgi:hypothetical protein